MYHTRQAGTTGNYWPAAGGDGNDKTRRRLYGCRSPANRSSNLIGRPQAARRFRTYSPSSLASSASSVMIATPSSWAFASLLPALSPAIR